MRRSSVEPLAVVTAKYRPLVTFADSEIDRSPSSWDERDQRRLAALSDDVQRAMTALET
jgi:hypothetical protein